MVLLNFICFLFASNLVKDLKDHLNFMIFSKKKKKRNRLVAGGIILVHTIICASIKNRIIHFFSKKKF